MEGVLTLERLLGRGEDNQTCGLCLWSLWLYTVDVERNHRYSSKAYSGGYDTGDWDRDDHFVDALSLHSVKDKYVVQLGPGTHIYGTCRL